MSPEQLRVLLERLQRGEVGVAEAQEQLALLPFSDLSFAKVDIHRQLRRGVPEVIFGEGKTTGQLRAIGSELVNRGQTVLMTRLEQDTAEQIGPLGTAAALLRYNPLARTATWLAPGSVQRHAGAVTIVTAGTSDLPVAEEARETLAACGVTAEVLSDVGVAGIHRLLAELKEIRRASVLIVVAGMEGALASVVGGLVKAPVIAVPTSVGYGAALGGLTALMGMLTSCASGVTCVNIDNGFGAAMAALRILGVPEVGEGDRA